MKNRGDGERSGIGFRVLTADRRSVAIFFPRLYPFFTWFLGRVFRKSNKWGARGDKAPSSGYLNL